jgi:uncharacterized protein YkwD
VPKTIARGPAAVVVALAAATSLLGPQSSAVAAVRTTTPPAPTFSYTNHDDWARSVFAQINTERAANGLKPLRWSDRLHYSAHRHNLQMGQANTLSHQLPGEASLGDRVTVWYSWSSCGENIAWNSRRTQAGALALETSMYDETPPDDGHRRNILSTTFVDVGVDVVDDSTHGRLWLTTDFGHPR